MISTAAALWHPLVSGEQADPVWELIDSIGSALVPWIDPPNSPGSTIDPTLASGLAGLALFYAHLDRARPDRGHDELAFQAFEGAVEALPEADPGAGLYAGFPGVAWLAEHLQDLYEDTEDEGDEEADDLNGEIDEALLPLLATTPWPWDYELIRGLAGLGLYGLERLAVPSGGEILRRVVDRLDECSEERAGGTVTWHTRSEQIFRHRERFPDGQDNLGLSHGVPGVVALLAEISRSPEALDALGAARSARVRELLEGSVAWLLGQSLAAGGTSRFPAQVTPGVEPVATRTAWCYGDPGVAAALWRSAVALGDAHVAAEALTTARLAFERPRREMKIDDAGLCHGSAGMLHMAGRFWRASGDPFFRRAAELWLSDTVDRHRPGEGPGGYRALMPDSQRGDFWHDDPGFLTGTAGIGLALLATVSPEPPGWDRVLWLDLPPAPGDDRKGQSC